MTINFCVAKPGGSGTWTKFEFFNSVNCDRPGECSPEKDCLR